MSIKQKNKFISSEKKHNLISVIFFFILSTYFLILFLMSSINSIIIIAVPSAIALVFSMAKLILQIIMNLKFSNFLKKIESNVTVFYISKSWNRKKESTTWVSAASIYINTIFLILTLSLIEILPRNEFILSLIMLCVNLFVILITTYLNKQLINSYLKYSAEKMDFNSIEWIQAKKEQNIFYKTIFFWFVSATLVIPLIFMVSIKYRKFVNNIIQNKN